MDYEKRIKEIPRDEILADLYTIGSLLVDIDNEVFHSVLNHENSNDPRIKEIWRVRGVYSKYFPTFQDVKGILSPTPEKTSKQETS